MSSSHSVVSSSFATPGLWSPRLLCPWDSPGKNIEVGCHFLLQGIFLTQGSNPGLPGLELQAYSLLSEPPEKPPLPLSFNNSLEKLTELSNVQYFQLQWHPTPVLLPGKSRGWSSLEGCSPQGCWGSDTTERLHFHFHSFYCNRKVFSEKKVCLYSLLLSRFSHVRLCATP